MSSVADFPDELCEQILQVNSLSPRDICHIASVSSRFYSLATAQRLWKIKFGQRYPSLFSEIISWPEAYFLEAQICADDWLSLYKLRYKLDASICCQLTHFSQQNILRESLFLSDINFAPFGDCGFLKVRFTLDSLHAILSNGKPNENLTHRFYAAQVTRYLCHKILSAEMRAWLENPECLEKGAFLVANWFLTEMTGTFQEMSDFLDRIALDVKTRLTRTRPQHPVLHVDLCQEQSLRESWWSAEDCRTILESLGYTLDVEYQFGGNSADYYDPNNSFITKVIERRKGIPITLSIIYHAVARRLGVRCELVNFPSHMLIKFLEHPELPEAQRFSYIDVFTNAQKLMSQQETWQAKARLFHGSHAIPRDPSVFDTAAPIQVIRRMWNNLSRIDQRHPGVRPDTLLSAYKLGIILNPTDLNVRFMLARCYSLLDINYDQILGLMEEMVVPEHRLDIESQRLEYIAFARAAVMREAADKESELNNIEEKHLGAKKRSDRKHRNVKWSVGQIMRHRKYGYTCVVYGWDPSCNASGEWKERMGVETLERGSKQPFYNVLVCDGSQRYAAEDNLGTENNLVLVTHPKVGKFFDKFCGSYYRMNPELLAMYPEDSQATLDYCCKNHT